MVDDQDDMRLERATGPGYLGLQRQIDRRSSTDVLNRKLVPSASSIQRTKLWYPSPPMSRPPSPQRPTSEAPTTTISTHSPFPTATEVIPSAQARRTDELERSPRIFQSPAVSRPSSFGPRLQGPQSPDFPKPSLNRSSSQHDTGLLVEGSFAVERSPSSTTVGAFPARLGIPDAQPGPLLSHLEATNARFGAVPTRFDTTSTQLPAVAAPSLQQSTRGNKSKAHVASACINCKKAHLSCDVNRPCARCVASGKQDTCRDVQQKKRGRPRLREETQSQGEQISTDLGPSPLTTSTNFSPGPRRIAQPRRRRTDSIRSLPSQASDESFPGVYGPGYSRIGQPLPQGAHLQTYTPPDVSISPFDTPTVFLDLDLTVIRANRAFYQATNITENFNGRDLAEAVTPASPEGLASLRQGLRNEREAREPALMPPMNAPGQDPIEGVTEGDADRLTQGSIERTLMLMRRSSHPRPDPEIFRARVRLARERIYFVVLTIPPVQPLQAPPPMPSPLSETAFATSDTFGFRRVPATSIAHPSASSSSSPMPPPFPPPMQASPPGYRLAAPSAYPPSSLSPGWRPNLLPPPNQQYTSHLEHPPRIEGGPPRIPRAVDPFDARPSLSPRSFLPPPQSTAPMAEPSSSSAQAPVASEDDGEGEEEDGRPTSKRRKMDIHEVLQK